jgi:plastocyanin domain-containing protein
MDGSEIGVIFGGVAAIAFVLWYFFGAKPRVAATVAASGVQEVRITVKGGYDPDVIVVRQGQPVRLDFYRDETASCSDRVVFGDFGIARDLPAFQTTSIDFTPDKMGEFTFTCGMNMMRGKLVVEPAREQVHRSPRIEARPAR